MQQPEVRKKYLKGLRNRPLPTKEQLQKRSDSMKATMKQKINAGWIMPQETIDRIKTMNIGRKWWSNGIEQVAQKNCPGKGWVNKRLPYNKVLK